ncbi:MAG TPA: phenylacetate--CoA ligase family protein [Phycisphaerae bacterium]|nr:phenylacetate--CoA ligase family protein [Phycisphaerae bacterium]
MKRAFSRKNLWETLPRPVKAVAGRSLGWVSPEWLLGRKFRTWLRFLNRAQYWTREVATAYQVKRLRRLCRLAYEKSPYYRSVFRSAGFDPRDLKRPEDLSGLPLLDKNTLREHLEEMCTVPPDSPGVDYTSTGGTSGSPLHFYIGADRSAVEYAHLVSGWIRVGCTAHTTQAVLRGAVVKPDANGLRHEYDRLLRRHYYSGFHMTDEDMGRYLDHIGGLGPCYLHAYPSSIIMLARYMERCGRKAPGNIRGLLASSEIVYPQDRALAQRVFGVRLYSDYGMTEKVVLGAECEGSTDYHIWPTYGWFELLDSEGKPVREPGKRGEIVGTGFINSVTPFIRYRTGDEATYVGERCEACGREHVLIREVLGHRTQEMLVAGDGGLISWTAINMHDDTFANVRQFQFRQDTPGRAVLRVVPAAGFSPADRERIERRLREKLDGRIQFEVELADEIRLTERGKTTYVDQRIKIDHGPASSGG